MQTANWKKCVWLNADRTHKRLFGKDFHCDLCEFKPISGKCCEIERELDAEL